MNQVWKQPKWYQGLAKYVFVALLPTVALFALQHWLWYIACTLVKLYPSDGLIQPLTPLDLFHVTDAISGLFIFYGLSYVWWLVIPIVIYHIYGAKLYYRYVVALIFSYLVGFVIFLAIPTTSKVLYYPLEGGDPRMSITGTNFISKFLKSMRKHNSGVCALPSFHVIATYVIGQIQRSTLSGKYEMKISKKGNNGFFGINTFFTIMISLSTYIAHQHYFVDIPTAIVVCEAVYFVVVKLEKKPNFSQRFFTNLNVGLLFEDNKNVTWGGAWKTKFINAEYRTLGYTLAIILFIVICLGLLYSFSIGL